MEIKTTSKEIKEETAAVITAAVNAYILEQEMLRGQRYPLDRRPGK